MLLKDKDKDKAPNQVSEATAIYGALDPVTTALGGAILLNLPGSLNDDFSKDALTRQGLPKKVALHLQRVLRLTAQEMSDMLDISYRTYQRKTDDDLLGTYSSEQLIEIAEVIAHASEVLGSQTTAVEWLKTPLLGLNAQTPLSFLHNTFGIRLVRQALGRLEHGIFA